MRAIKPIGLAVVVVGLWMAAGYQRQTEFQHRVDVAVKSADKRDSAPLLVGSLPTQKLSYAFLTPTGNVDDFCEQIQFDARFTFNCEARQEYRLQNAMTVFVAGWNGSKMFWSSKPRLLKVGTLMFTDGENTYLAQCGNKISFVPQGPVMPSVPDNKLDEPEGPREETQISLEHIPSTVREAEIQQSTRKLQFPVIADGGIVAAGMASLWKNHSPEPSPAQCTDPIEVLKVCQ